MLDNLPREQLCFIIKKYGRSIAQDAKRCRAMLSDLAPTHRLENNLLIMALEQKLVQELLTPNPLMPISLRLNLLAKRLHDTVGIKEEFAYWAVETWALALDNPQQPTKEVDLPKGTYAEAIAYYDQQKFDKALPIFEKLANLGDEGGQYYLGLMYEDGKGVRQDNTQAVFWYRKAAEQNNPAAQSSLGSMYANGRGVKKDNKQAIFWFRKAAKQNNPAAQSNLGSMYENGQGVEQDDTPAAFWYERYIINMRY